MRSKILFLPFFALLGFACKKPAPPADAGPRPTASVSMSAAPVDTDAPGPTQPMIILLDAAPNEGPSPVVALMARWNEAHVNRDAGALLPLFAPKVTVNGTTLTSAELVKRKVAGFDSHPELRQSIAEVKTEATADGKETWAHFIKKLADDKSEKPHPMFVIVRDGLIIEESDDPADWCINKDRTTNGKTYPGFKLSAIAAVSAAKDSKHFAEIKKRVPHLGTDLFGFGCAKRCATPRRECGYHFRISDMEFTKGGQGLEWLYVDPVTKVLWWQEKDWISEQLR